MTLPVLQLEKVGRSYKQGATALEVLHGVDFALFPSQSVALVAQSGTGKSTLLHIAGLLERPDEGEVFVGGQPTTSMPDDGRTAMRRDTIGRFHCFYVDWSTSAACADDQHEPAPARDLREQGSAVAHGAARAGPVDAMMGPLRVTGRVSLSSANRDRGDAGSGLIR